MKCKAHPLFYYVSVATAACVEPLFFGKFDMHIYITLNTFVLASKGLRRNFFTQRMICDVPCSTARCIDFPSMTCFSYSYWISLLRKLPIKIKTPHSFSRLIWIWNTLERKGWRSLHQPSLCNVFHSREQTCPTTYSPVILFTAMT